MSARQLVIVGGRLEQQAFDRWFSRKALRLLNGACATDSLDGLRLQIRAIVDPHQRSLQSLLVVLDRERSQESSADLAEKIKLMLAREVPKRVKIGVVCPDIMIENWILADVLSWKHRAYIRDACRQRNFDGKHGKNELKKMFKQKNSYEETSHGVELMRSIREDVAQLNSPSFAKFVQFLK